MQCTIKIQRQQICFKSGYTEVGAALICKVNCSKACVQL